MIDLSSFVRPLSVGVIGASGGIGAALVEHLQSHEQVEALYRFARNAPDMIAMDICDEQSVREAVSVVDGELDIVILATGFLSGDGVLPEKGVRDITAENMRRVMDVNVIGPALVAKHFIPRLPRTGKSVFAALSARVGSISDNRLGGWHSYRASKAALNMVLKNISIETCRKYNDAAVIGLHPGTVDTRLSSPFQSGVKDGQLFSAAQSAAYLLDVINRVDSGDTGKVFAWDGQEIQP